MTSVRSTVFSPASRSVAVTSLRNDVGLMRCRAGLERSARSCHSLASARAAISTVTETSAEVPKQAPLRLRHTSPLKHWS